MKEVIQNYRSQQKKGIAKGAGRDISELNALLKQFEQMSKMMKMVQFVRGLKANEYDAKF